MAQAAGQDVVKLMAALTTATDIAGKATIMGDCMSQAVSAVTEKVQKICADLNESASDIKEGLASFHDAMEEAKTSGEFVKVRCQELSAEHGSFETQVTNLFESNSQVSKADVEDIMRKIQTILECAGNCGPAYDVFKKKLIVAIDLGSAVASKCKAAANRAGRTALITRIAGFGTAALAAIIGALIAAKGETEGLSLLPAAVGIGKGTLELAAKLEEPAKEFDALRSKLQGCLKELHELGDSVAGMLVVTEEMVKHLKVALNVIKSLHVQIIENEARRLRQEQLEQENEALLRQVRELQASAAQREAGN